jgi:hypothetical protein
MAEMTLYPRFAQSRLEEALMDTPVKQGTQQVLIGL